MKWTVETWQAIRRTARHYRRTQGCSIRTAVHAAALFHGVI